jgi:Rhodopirellula transposase DDE domain
MWYCLRVDTRLAEHFVEQVAAVYAEVREVLDERQRRLMLGAAARRVGRGGIKQVAAAVGVVPETVSRGVADLKAGVVADGRVRVRGAGRKPVTETTPGVVAALEALVDPVTRGDPESPLRWTNKSTRKLAEALTAQGFAVGPNTVAKLLKTSGYQLQANAKTVEGRQHPDRDAQFEYVNTAAVAFLAAGEPVISVDTKKRELVGAFKNGGREWEPIGQPAEVLTHDFPGDAVGVALPYGVYDMGANTGWVNVGTDHDTATFAAESIRRWWRHVGADAYPKAKRLLITADSGGSNGARLRLWKNELARFADETGLAVTVVHLPPGTSKWNKVEHRLFSHITMNWRGRPLSNHEVVVNTIAATTTRTGLKVKAMLDHNTYPTGLRITDRQMRELLRRHITRHQFHGDWNYDVHPTADDDHEALATPITPTRPNKRP